MIFKKVLISLGVLGLIGGSGAGVYYRLQEDKVEEDKRSSEKLAPNNEVESIADTKAKEEGESNPEIVPDTKVVSSTEASLLVEARVQEVSPTPQQNQVLPSATALPNSVATNQAEDKGSLAAETPAPVDETQQSTILKEQTSALSPEPGTLNNEGVEHQDNEDTLDENSDDQDDEDPAAADNGQNAKASRDVVTGSEGVLQFDEPRQDVIVSPDTKDTNIEINP